MPSNPKGNTRNTARLGPVFALAWRFLRLLRNLSSGGPTTLTTVSSESKTLSKRATRSYYPVHAFAAATRIAVASVSGSGCRWAMSELRFRYAPE